MSLAKNLLLVPCFLLFIVGVLNAQHQMKPASERAAKITAWMKTNLQLTPDQETKVQAINLKYAERMDGMMAGGGTKKQKARELKDNDASKDAELKGVLSDSQFQTYYAKKEELKKALKEKKKSGL